MLAKGEKRRFDSASRILAESKEVSLGFFLSSRPSAASRKSDGSIVTEADNAVEEFIRDCIASEFPGDMVMGEEFGGRVEEEGWILDPIDGTPNFAAGLPNWATLLSYRSGGKTRFAFVVSPILGSWWATDDSCGTARSDEGPLRVSKISKLSDARISLGGLYNGDPLGLKLIKDKRGESRLCCGDWWGHMLVAMGSVDAMVESSLRVWDYDAPAHIVRVAGGRVTTASGSNQLKDGHSVVSTNGIIHEEVLQCLAR